MYILELVQSCKSRQYCQSHLLHLRFTEPGKQASKKLQQQFACARAIMLTSLNDSFNLLPYKYNKVAFKRVSSLLSVRVYSTTVYEPLQSSIFSVSHLSQKENWNLVAPFHPLPYFYRAKARSKTAVPSDSTHVVLKRVLFLWKRHVKWKHAL